MASWLDKALDTVSNVAVGYFQADAQKEQAEIEKSIAQSTIETNRLNAQTTNTAKNILLILGGTIGALLVYKMAVKTLK